MDRRAIRAACVLIVAAVHVVLIAMLLRTASDRPPRPAPAVERTIWLAPIARPKPSQSQAQIPPPTISPAAPAYPDYRGITLPPDVFANQSPGLNRSLFGCDGLDLKALTPEQRAHCTAAPYALMHPDDGVDFHDGAGRSRYAALWARRLAIKQGPLLLPCANPQAASIDLGTVLCVAKGAIEGFDLDAQPSYADKIEQTHLPNNGDPPDKPN